MDRLVELLLWRPDDLKPTPERSLLFPISVTPAVVASRRTAFGRVSALVWGIEVALRFLLAVFLSELREKDDSGIASDLARLIAPDINRPLSLGKAAEITALLAKMVLRTNSLLAPLARNVLMARGKKARLPEKLWTAIQRRNWNAHGPGLPEETYQEDETLLSEAFQVLTVAMAPLENARLSSVQEIVRFGFDGEAPRSISRWPRSARSTCCTCRGVTFSTRMLSRRCSSPRFSLLKSARNAAGPKCSSAIKSNSAPRTSPAFCAALRRITTRQYRYHGRAPANDFTKTWTPPHVPTQSLRQTRSPSVGVTRVEASEIDAGRGTTALKPAEVSSTEKATAEKILPHLGLAAELPAVRPRSRDPTETYAEVLPAP